VNTRESQSAIRAGPGSTDGGLASLKKRLVSERLSAGTEPGVERMARLAATEAEALAWQTPYPLLVLPALLDEKLDYVSRYAERQQNLLRHRAARAK
jgi:hypothetical protein